MKKYRKIGTTVMLMSIIIATVITLALGILIKVSLNKVANRSLKTMEERMRADYDEMIKGQVQAVITMIEPIKEMVASGQLTEDKGKELAASLIRKARYLESGYFWVDTTEGKNVVLLGSAAEGTDRTDLVDVNGFKIVEKFLELGNGGSGSGYLEYYYPKEGETIPSPKRAYVQAYKPFGWIIGTGNYIDEFDKIIASETVEKNNYLNKVTVIIIVEALIALGLCVAASLIYGNMLSRKMALLSSLADSMSEYDFRDDDGNTDKKPGNSELDGMIETFKGVRKNLRMMALATIEDSNSVSDISDNLFEIVKSNAETASKAAGALDNVSDRVTEQAESTSSAAVANKNARALVENTLRILEKLETSVQVIDDRKNEGMALLKELKQAGRNSSEAFDIMKVMTGETSESAEKISAASQMIQSISDQTNLLALNAAIEAARAGEQGKGFAVVAEEIRKLAEQSAEFTKDIRAVIDVLMRKSEDSVAMMEKVSSAVDRQSDIRRAASGKFEEIATEVVSSRTVVEELKTSAARIEIESKSIMDMIESLSAISEENAASMEEVNAMVTEEAAQMGEISEMGSELNGIAGRLKSEMSNFKI